MFRLILLQPKQIPLIVCCLVIILIPIVLMVRDTGNHNAQLAAVARRLYSIPSPPATTELDRRASITVLSNGKACDYVVEQTFRTTLAERDILTYYQATTEPILTRSSRSVSVPYAAQYYPISLNHQLGLLIIPNQQKPNELIFTLQLVDGRDDADFDPCCY